jgi:hypothetical protein
MLLHISYVLYNLSRTQFAQQRVCILSVLWDDVTPSEILLARTGTAMLYNRASWYSSNKYSFFLPCSVPSFLSSFGLDFVRNKLPIWPYDTQPSLKCWRYSTFQEFTYFFRIRIFTVVFTKAMYWITGEVESSIQPQNLIVSNIF